MVDDNSWKEWRNYVLSTIEKIENRQDKLEQNNKTNEINITKISAKATVYGTIAGIIASAVLSLIVGFILYGITHSSNQNINNIKKGNYIEKQVPSQKRSSDVNELCEEIVNEDGKKFYA